MIAVTLMVVGLALLGVITAAIASWFVERISEVKEAEDLTDATLEELRAELAEVRRVMASLVARERDSGQESKEQPT